MVHHQGTGGLGAGGAEETEGAVGLAQDAPRTRCTSHKIHLAQDVLSPLMRRLLFGCHSGTRTLERTRRLGFDAWISHYLLRPLSRPPDFGLVATLRETVETVI
jgi:hypothetical protein